MRDHVSYLLARVYRRWNVAVTRTTAPAVLPDPRSVELLTTDHVAQPQPVDESSRVSSEQLRDPAIFVNVECGGVGLMTTLGNDQSTLSFGRGSSVRTSRAANPTRPSWSAAIKAGSSTTDPRPTLTIVVPGLTFARNSALTRSRVASVSGRVITTASTWLAAFPSSSR